MHSKLVLGEPSIDRQHEELLSRFESLSSAGISTERLSDTLSGLTVQICSHFRAEEMIMTQLSLPEGMYHEHCQDHLRIIEEITNTHLDSMYGRGISPEQVISKVANWVVQHLVEFDLTLKPYIQFIQASPRSGPSLAP